MVAGAAVNSPDPSEAAAVAILAYLQRNRNAADTADGVARWWVGDDGRFTLGQVQRALDRLVKAGRLRREQLADGTWLYAGTGPKRGSHSLH